MFKMNTLKVISVVLSLILFQGLIPWSANLALQHIYLYNTCRLGLLQQGS